MTSDTRVGGSRAFGAERAGLWLRRPDVLAAIAALVWAALAYRAAHAGHFAVVESPEIPTWWRWADQGRYYRAAQAWASFSLDPAQHWYFAGYPLLGAALFRLMPGQPFYLVDMACLLLFGVALALLARRLADGARWASTAGMATFLVTVVLTPFMMKSFVEPWTTTPTSVLSIGALLLAFRLWDRPSSERAASLGLAAGAVVLFRPTDAVPLALALTIWSGVALRKLGARDMLRMAGAGLAGAMVPVLVTAAAYVAVFGLQRSDYLAQSGQTGFEWRLIPLHWVTLFVSPLPEFHDEYSLAQTFPWIVPGVAGMVACLVATRGITRRRHALVITAVTLHCVMYLAYRDLHPTGLFRYGNYHYFKWCVPVFGLYSVFLATEVTRHGRRAAAWGAAMVVATGLFSWRMAWREVPAGWLAEARVEGAILTLPQAPHSVYDGLFVPAEGGFAQIYLAGSEMRVGERIFRANADFKAFPTSGGLILTVLRPMPAGAASIRFDDGVRLRPGRLRMLRARLTWRWPHVWPVVVAYYRRWCVDG